MTSISSDFTILENGMILHLRRPLTDSTGGISLLLHGWTGDENSMNTFWNYMPASHWLVSPRGPQTADPSGYAWAQITPNMYPEFDKLLPSAMLVIDQIVQFKKKYNLEKHSINLVGFSQGAALAYLMAAYIPDQIQQIVAIAGFLPDGTLDVLQKQSDRSVKISIFHGEKDKLVPVEMAQKTQADLLSLGYTVHLCVDENTGHKLGPSCVDYLKRLQEG